MRSKLVELATEASSDEKRASEKLRLRCGALAQTIRQTRIERNCQVCMSTSELELRVQNYMFERFGHQKIFEYLSSDSATHAAFENKVIVGVLRSMDCINPVAAARAYNVRVSTLRAEYEEFQLGGPGLSRAYSKVKERLNALINHPDYELKGPIAAAVEKVKCLLAEVNAASTAADRRVTINRAAGILAGIDSKLEGGHHWDLTAETIIKPSIAGIASTGTILSMASWAVVHTFTDTFTFVRVEIEKVMQHMMDVFSD